MMWLLADCKGPISLRNLESYDQTKYLDEDNFYLEYHALWTIKTRNDYYKIKPDIQNQNIVFYLFQIGFSNTPSVCRWLDKIWLHL